MSDAHAQQRRESRRDRQVNNLPGCKSGAPSCMPKSGTYAIYPGDLRRAFPSIKAQDEEREGFGFPVWDVS